MPTYKYDVIVSNPPYIKTHDIDLLEPDVRDYEPILALDGGTAGLRFYYRIAEIADELLNPDGTVAVEVGHDQADSVSDIMTNAGIIVETINDLAGIRRVVCGRKSTCSNHTKNI